MHIIFITGRILIPAKVLAVLDSLKEEAIREKKTMGRSACREYGGVV
jgi:uncharacterized protein YacL